MIWTASHAPLAANLPGGRRLRHIPSFEQVFLTPG
jgi:hypothetical protein